MIGTLVLYGLAFVGALAILAAVGVTIFCWRLPAATRPGEESPSPAEVIAGHTSWRNADQELTHVRVVPPRDAS